MVEVVENGGLSSRRTLQLSGHVGFDSLPNQLVSKEVSRGFTFNILCVGETCIGKSTLMDTLFNTRFGSTPVSHDLPEVKLEERMYDLREGNVKLKLTVVETQGYGDQVNMEKSWHAIVDYIERQFERYLQEELKIKRTLGNYLDTRVHACLFFIAPTGHSLKALDLVVMKQLDKRVNIIPIVAKADTITNTEMHRFKAQIIKELSENGIMIYQFPMNDDLVAGVNSEMNNCMPFAVVGSTQEVKVGNKSTRARQYRWGVVQVENENHCDFVKLREMLLRTNMEDLRERTHAVHYERYRRQRLREMGFGESGEQSWSEAYESRRQQHLEQRQKEEAAVRESFLARVKEKDSQLKEQEQTLHKRFDQIMGQRNEEKKQLEVIRKQLEEDMAEFERRKHIGATQTLKGRRK